MKIKYNNIKSRFDYNPRYEYYDGFEDDVVNVLIKKGYDAESDMGISQMKIVSTAPESVLKEVISDIEDLFN
jgi:hypothetical protein|tara:strand:- start:454 stop:669 length:216 start_codon:yes stop_codon:yes gene_type:complete